MGHWSIDFTWNWPSEVEKFLSSLKPHLAKRLLFRAWNKNVSGGNWKRLHVCGSVILGSARIFPQQVYVCVCVISSIESIASDRERARERKRATFFSKSAIQFWGHDYHWNVFQISILTLLSTLSKVRRHYFSLGHNADKVRWLLCHQLRFWLNHFLRSILNANFNLEKRFIAGPGELLNLCEIPLMWLIPIFIDKDLCPTFGN